MAKRKWTGMLAFTLATSLLAACGSTTDGGATTRPSSPAASPTSSATPSQPEPVTLTLWETSRTTDDFALQLENEFLESHPHITLNKVIREGDPGNEFYQAVAAGNAPDLVGVSFAMIDQYMRAGILEPMNDYFAEWEEADGYIQEYLDLYTRDGILYGIPNSIAPVLFGYNKSLFDQAGLTEAPGTWEEALEAAKLIADPSNQITGYATLTAEWTEWFFQYYVWQAGGDLTKENPDGTIELTFTDPAVIAAAEYYQSLRTANVLQADITMKFNDLVESFARGQIGMMPFAADWVSWAISLGMDADDIGLALPPAGPGGSQATAISGNGWTINAGTTQEKKDAAWEYIKFQTAYDTRVKRLENQKSKGSTSPTVSPRNDIDITEHLDLPDEYRNVLAGVNTVGRLEFYGKSQFGIYVDRAVQRIITEPHADPAIELQIAQELATSEALDEFNANITD